MLPLHTHTVPPRRMPRMLHRKSQRVELQSTKYQSHIYVISQEVEQLIVQT